MYRIDNIYLREAVPFRDTFTIWVKQMHGDADVFTVEEMRGTYAEVMSWREFCEAYQTADFNLRSYICESLTDEEAGFLDWLVYDKFHWEHIAVIDKWQVYYYNNEGVRYEVVTTPKE